MIKKNVYLVDMGSGSNMNLLPLAICMIGSYSLEQQEIQKKDRHLQKLREQQKEQQKEKQQQDHQQ